MLNTFKKKLILSKNIITSINGIRAYYSIMCGYSCIGFIGFMLKSKSFFHLYFLPNEYETSKFKWTFNITIEKIILNPIWATKKFFWEVAALLDVNDATLRKWQKP